MGLVIDEDSLMENIHRDFINFVSMVMFYKFCKDMDKPKEKYDMFIDTWRETFESNIEEDSIEQLDLILEENEIEVSDEKRQELAETFKIKYNDLIDKFIETLNEQSKKHLHDI